MAEPVFDEHPLEEYFRQSGENTQIIPGGSTEFSADDELSSECVQLPSFLLRAVEFVNRIYPSRSSPENEFAERFKYDVISSSLLSTSIAAPPSASRRAFSPELPGRLDDETDDSASAAVKSNHRSSTPPFFTELQWPVLLISLAVFALAAEFYFFAIFFIGGATYGWHAVKAHGAKANTMSAMLLGLNELISAGNVWDSAVNEAVSIIEKEERSIFYGPSNAHSPSSGLRVTLQSSSHTTQVQCDNVRQLLSALTDPSQVTQLSEMYAPASPIQPSFSIFDHPRPVSDPIGRHRTMSPPMNKRATWNGSYAALALAGSPTSRLSKRRSGVIGLLNPPTERKFASVSAPVSPHAPVSLQDVQEEDDSELSDSHLPQTEFFGAAALDLQRKRRTAGLEAISVPPPSYSPRSNRFSGSTAFNPVLPSILSSSRFTSVHTTRHPLSLSGLQLALHGALSAKRYACSHLLALRFDEDEDHSYWEDVRSVMALLTSTFEDASARLMEALDDAEKKRVKDQRPSPERSGGSAVHPARSMAEMISFAPIPSHLTRFAAHVDAISSALNDAREHLEECVASLRDQSTPGDHRFTCTLTVLPPQEHPAFQAYDRLRKELGYALRECERGRERLLDIVSPGPTVDADLEGDDTPGLGHDDGSDASDKLGPTSPAFPERGILGVAEEQAGLETASHRGDDDFDDATAHLLLTATSKHLPPPGVEQVFEADTGGVALFTRERSTLSREERIKLSKARREQRRSGSMLMPEPLQRPPSVSWAPGGEVVQELKDVIWKVSERRRKMAERSESEQPAVAAADTPRTEVLFGPEVHAEDSR